ncbi:MAG: biopolymer transporter ExbD [Gemmatimonadales bacterium]
MAGGSSAAPGEVSAEPNVIPMIDIMLVMLIIFMVSQPLSRMALDVQVPPQETATKSTAASNQIVLELLADGGYAINTQPVPHDQLDTQIHAIFDTRPAKLMFVKSDPNRVYQDVIEAMDVARGAGVQVIGFTPAPPAGGAPAAAP